MSTPKSPDAWTDLPEGRTTIQVDGKAWEAFRLGHSWSIWRMDPDATQTDKPQFSVSRGAEFWAGPGREWCVPNDIGETFRIVAQGGYDCGMEDGPNGPAGANCHGCHKTKGKVHR